MPYVESLYPSPGTTLYRKEPAILAFNERFDILQGLDRPVQPTDPDERLQRCLLTANIGLRWEVFEGPTNQRIVLDSPAEKDITMSLTTILIIVVLLLLLSGGFYGRGRWY